jgi:sterol desaturase/sphingolipid hydroxylase (fatty acid hydroxylase superfamily)
MEMNVYALLTPVLLALIALEILYCLWRRPAYYNFQDSMANLATAVLNQVVNVAVGAGVYFGYAAIRARWPLPAPSSALVSTALLFVGIDFLFYWFHRAGHRINIMWAAHSPHHTSEELNYTVAAKASVTQRLASFLFYAPLAPFFPAERLVPAILIHHVLQFWQHTRTIERLPRWFEAVFNAPTHHRVHHGANDRYLDKNYGGVLIIWDRLFGTYEPETEPVIYGVRPPIETWEVLDTNFHYYKLLWAEAKAAPYWLDKLLIWFMPLEWRPRGAAPWGEKYTPGSVPKYKTELSTRVKAYLAAQVLPVLGLMLLVTKHDSPLPAGQRLLAAAVVAAATLVWGGLLENAAWAVPLELARLALTPLAVPVEFQLPAAALSLLSALWLLVPAARRAEISVS